MRSVSGFVRGNYHTGDGGFQRTGRFYPGSGCCIVSGCAGSSIYRSGECFVETVGRDGSESGLGSSGTGGTFGADKAGAKRNSDPDDKGSIRGWNFPVRWRSAETSDGGGMLYHKSAQIWILDEPTAALDAIAESEVYEKFRELGKEKTCIYISHRLASTQFMDRIILLKDGKIQESGTHKELMAQNRMYARLYEIQSRYYREEEQQ